MLFWVNYLCMYNTVDSSVINSDIPPYFLIFVPCIVLLQLLPYLCRHRRFMAASFSKAIITVSWLQIRLPVTGGVSCPDATGLRKFHPCRHSAVSAETTTVGDERCSPAGILFVAVRAHHPAASPIALAESSGAHRLQACSPCVQVPSRSSTAVPRRRTQPAGQSEPPFHHVVIAVRSAYAAVNYRRPGLSSRCSPCLELSAAARHVCTVSFHLPKPSEDSPLQPLLSSCQAREVIPSLRPFLLLLLLLLMYLMLGNTGVNTVLCMEHLVAGTK